MTRRRSLLACAAAGVLPGGVLRAADPVATGPERFFAEEGAVGCFALQRAGSGETLLIDPVRARRRYIPASTFKIPNSLIALEAGAVRDEHEVVPYGGKPQHFRHWERDADLRDAFAASSVPIYQELARRVGLDRMRRAVAAFDYGNADIGPVVDRFWLDGPLAISAVEQAGFLARLALARLPVAARSLEIVRRISTVETRDGARLHLKTGWVFGTRPQIGWWVGWAERGSELQSFALNIDMASEADAAKRQRIGRRLLQHFGVFASAGSAG